MVAELGKIDNIVATDTRRGHKYILALRAIACEWTGRAKMITQTSEEMTSHRQPDKGCLLAARLAAALA